MIPLARPALALGALLCAAALPAAAQDGAIRPLWLTPDAEIGDLPAARLASPPPSADPQVLLGELVFRSSITLGGEARRAGLSCEACHPAGGAHTGFFVPGLSGEPGTIDVTHGAWNPAHDDGIVNPLRIPPLWNLARTAPYGHRGTFADLPGFVRHVIVDEFAGPEPAPALLDALVAYLGSLAPPPNRNLDPMGTLTAAAPSNAQRGREAFEKGCAGCHQPASAFQDGKQHALKGEDGMLATPSLLGLAAMDRLWHDGRFDSLPETVVTHARALGIGHGEDARRWLIAYVAAVAEIDTPAFHPVTAAEDLDRLAAMVERLLVQRAPEGEATAEAIAEMLRYELGRIHARFPDAAGVQATLEGWADGLRAVAEAGDDAGARDAAGRLLDRLKADRALIETAAPASLYDPGRLEAWKASRRAR